VREHDREADDVCLARGVALCRVAGPREEPEPDADVQPPGEVQPRPKLELMPKRAPTGTFELGAGYATDDGFLATARVAQPRLFGTDKGLSLSALVSERRQEFLTRYEDPTLFDVLHLRGDLYSRRKLYPGFQREAAGGMLALGRRIAPNLDVFVGYRLEQVERHARRGDGAVSRRASEPFWRGGMIGAVRTGVHYSTLERDHYPARAPTSARRSRSRIAGSDPTSTTCAPTRGSVTTARSVRSRSTSARAPARSRTCPFPSASTSTARPRCAAMHRARRPTDPITGLPTGGNFLWSHAASSRRRSRHEPEPRGLRRRRWPLRPWGGQTAASAGFGVIWRSPIGPLRFDVAYPLDGGKPRYIFGIGGVF